MLQDADTRCTRAGVCMALEENEAFMIVSLFPCKGELMIMGDENDQVS